MPYATRSGPIRDRHTRTPQQTRKDGVAHRIVKRWPIMRTNKLSRGLNAVVNNHCYVVTSIQNLLHLPRFMNWVNTHNNLTPAGIIENPCMGNGYDYRCGNINIHSNQCMGCATKTLIAEYWGSGNLNAIGVPQALPAITPGLAPILRFALNKFGTTQEDPSEFVDELLEAIVNSSHNLVPGLGPIFNTGPNTLWGDRYNSLFEVEYKTTDRCIICNTPRPTMAGTVPAERHLYPVTINTTAATRPDDRLEDAISRVLQDLIQVHCPTCGIPDAPMERETKILSAPEHLVVPVTVQTLFHGKNYTPIKIPQTLDLTSHQVDTTTPLRYTLSTVALHTGPIGHGHYIATVRGPNKVSMINNTQAVVPPRWNQGLLSQNPQHWPPTERGTGLSPQQLYQNCCCIYTRVGNEYTRGHSG